ncbi:translocation/assembly module TamB domain-containing protein [Sphingobacterium sp. JB170]|uniref:translocation/assembly module TamB domain-containing protein n=1 Tax=Sphingobacterium sp. JB170 TaxID=1434842 RepID=UPI00097F0A5D|nr:translocation/assembly module TamB domain-containing protein [Sphingobacterium sp. JB170]SJN40144.1 hypothetical protein FM107_10460 [Sphingobacterium sp. JB170]
MGKVTTYLENKLGTPVDIGYVNITFPKKLELNDVYFEDQSKDTLIAGEKLIVDINMLKLINNTVQIDEFTLEGITAKINRTLPDSAFNFDYIVQAFATKDESTPSTDSSAALIFDIDDVIFNRIHFVYNDEVIGTSADLKIDHFDTKLERFDLTDNMAFAMPKINLDGLQVIIKQWQVAAQGEGPSVADLGLRDSTLETSSLMPGIAIDELNLANIFVQYANEPAAISTTFKIDALNADVKEIDLNKEVVRFGQVTLDGSDSDILLGKLASKPTSTDPQEESSPINWKVSADRLAVNKTKVAFKDDNQARMKGFDYFNIGITDFTGDLNDLYYSSDSISGSLKTLTMNDHSGFLIKELRGDFVYGDRGLELQNLLAQTPKTTIRDHIKVTYPSLDAFNDNPNSVNIEARINKSTLDMSDILYFVPDLDTMEVMKPLLSRSFFIDGRVAGTMDNLNIPKIEFKTLNKTHILASAIIKGLPDTEKLNIDLNLKKFTTGRSDLDHLIAKSMLPDSIQLPNAISLSGTFKGGLAGFDANMSLITEQGNATFNGKLAMAQDTTYDAYVSINDFNIGSLLSQDSLLGYVSANAKVQGRGLNPETMVANIEGELNQLQAMGYDYHDIKLAVSANQGDIEGNLNSPDPNVQLNMDFHADMREKYPKLYATLNVDTLNLKNLNIIEDNFRYQGKIVAELETADLDFLNGSLLISNSSIAYNNDRFSLDSVAIFATADSTRNSLILESGFLSAHMVGKYRLTELSSSVQDIIHMYYNPEGTPPPEEINYQAQNFEFSATLRNSPFIREFLPELEELQNVTLDGTFDSESKSFMAKLIAPKILYDGMRIENIGVDITTADSTLYYSALIEKINVSNLELSNTVLSGSAKENNLDFGLWIKDEDDKEQYHLGANMSVDENDYMLKLNEDGLMLNYENWQIPSDNALSFGTNGISAQNFRLSKDGQELLLQSADSTLNAPLDLTFTNFRIETLTEILKSEMLNVGGGINGTATISRMESSPVFVSDVNIEKFYFGTDTVGNVLIKVDNVRENTFAADVKIVENGNDVHLLGDFNSPPNGPATLNATLSLNPMKMTTIQAFSLGYLEKSAGDLKGNLTITGTLDQPRINGDLTFEDAKINVAMLNADMMLNKQVIHFNNQGIQFRKFEIKDLKGNTAKLNGSVRTQSYTDFDFNLTLSTDDFAAVNSTREDNDLFFGQLYITSNIRITGNLDHPRIDGSIKANDKTDFVLIVPNDDPGIAQRDGVVQFVDRSDTARTNAFARLDSLTTATQLSGYDIALNLTTDRDAKFKVILDEGTQDALNIQGIAELNATIDASDKITMSGTYTVERGDYTFSLGPISKKFTFQKGSTITWNGDPLDARLGITAIYSNRFSTLELVQSQIGSESQNLYKQRVPFDVKLILTGELFKPMINFDIDLDENNAIVSQDVVSKVNIALANIRGDQAELNKQVFSLLTLGRFMSSNPFESLAGGGAEGFARSTVSSFLTNQLNSMASNLIQGVELDFNLQSEEDYLTGSAETRTDLNVGISKMLFDDRLKVTIGSNFEVEGNSRPGENAANIASDISLEYQLSKDGRYFARVYRKNQYQATLQGQFVETGIGFIINMSYDKFKELFMNSKALEQYYDVDSRGFQRRFDIDRMNVDSTYRDSVRIVIRDSLLQNSPSFRKRWEQRQREREELKKNNDSSSRGQVDSTQAIVPKEEEIPDNEDETEKENGNKDSKDKSIEPKKIESEDERSKDEL